MSNLKHESECKEILAECWDKVLAFFDNNATKTFQWFRTPNLQLADKTPIWMLKTGRGQKLKQFIKFFIRRKSSVATYAPSYLSA